MMTSDLFGGTVEKTARKKRGRGSDYKQRFQTSRWAEDIFFEHLNTYPEIITIRFGLSKVTEADEIDVGDESIKEPDLLAYRRSSLTKKEVSYLVEKKLALDEIPRSELPEFIYEKVTAAFEVEFSPYKAAEMKDRHKLPAPYGPEKMAPKKMPAPPTAPNIFVKDEDLGRLTLWQERYKVPEIFVTHFFDQEAFMINLKKISEFKRQYNCINAAEMKELINLQRNSGIFFSEQSYDRVDAQGAGEKKWVFRVHPKFATKLGVIQDVSVGSDLSVSSSKKYVSHVLFSGGKLTFSDEFFVDTNLPR
jgi:hypothetical protein